jgi:acyl-coenzyme A thioesterase PaaI-like protein
MTNQFEQISIKPGFMKHNGGLLFREISENEFEFKTIIKENHLNAIGITHGGYISSIIDSGAGTSAYRAANNSPCVTISLDIKFIGATKLNDEIIGFVKILKRTKSMIFLICHLKSNEKTIASASGIWKIINK